MLKGTLKTTVSLVGVAATGIVTVGAATAAVALDGVANLADVCSLEWSQNLQELGQKCQGVAHSSAEMFVKTVESANDGIRETTTSLATTVVGGIQTGVATLGTVACSIGTVGAVLLDASVLVVDKVIDLVELIKNAKDIQKVTREFQGTSEAYQRLATEQQERIDDLERLLVQALRNQPRDEGDDGAQ